MAWKPHRITQLLSSSRRRKPRPGRASVTSARPRCHWTEAAGSSTACRIPRTWIITSSLTRPSSTSTPWTATGYLGEDSIAEALAETVVQASTDFDGTERAPMRLAEARITLGVVAAREGDLEHAVQLGSQALSGERKSLPSLVMVSRDLTQSAEGALPARAGHRRLPRRTERCQPDVGVRPIRHGPRR